MDENSKLLIDHYGETSRKLADILETLTRESKETREKLTQALNLLQQAIEKLAKT